MPEQGTKRQEEIFDKLTEYLGKKGYEYLGYNGLKDDNHIFGRSGVGLMKRKVYCYIKYISVRATKRPPESLLVLVKQNSRNKNVKEFKLDKPNFWNNGSRSVFVILRDQESYKKALRLIDTI